MSIPISQKVDLLYKQAFGVTKTDTESNKSPSNEAIASPLLIRGDTLWSEAGQIPGVAAATAGLVTAYTGTGAQECTADNTTVPVGGVYPTWKTGLTYWIPAEFGSTYSVGVWVDDTGVADPTSTGTQIFGAGSGGTGEFFYNYQSGVLNFIGETIPTALTSSKVLYIVGYRYIGLTGVSVLPDTQIGNIDITNQTLTGQVTDANIIFAPDGTGQVVTSGNITASYFYGNGAYLSGIDATGIQNGTSNVSIPAEDGNIQLNVDGDLTANITSTGINVAGYVNATGNGTFGNVAGGNLVSATYFTGTLINGTSNITTVNNGNIDIVSAGNTSVVVTGTGANVAGHVTATSNVTGGNLLTGGLVLATGNVTGGNLTTAGLVLATGNVTGGNLTTAGLVLATGNVTGGNLTTAGLASVTGNVTAGNLVTAGEITDGTLTINSGVIASGVSATFSGNGAFGNVAGGNLVSATYLTGVLIDGTSNVTVNNNGNVDITVGANTTVAVTATGANIVGTLNANGIATLGAIVTSQITGASGGNLTLTAGSSDDYIELRPTGTGQVHVGGFKIEDLGAPTASTDAATKQYVDDIAQGLSIQKPCVVASTATLAVMSSGTVAYDNGTSGVGATLTISGSTITVIDGVTLTIADRILIKDEADSAHDGIYTYTSTTVLTRATDFDTPVEMAGGDFTFIQQGTVYNDTGWVMTDPVTTIGTDDVNFVQFSGAGSFTAGAGLTLTGTEFSVNVDDITTAISGGNVVVKTSAQFTTPNIGVATGTSLDATGNVSGGNITTVGLVSATGNVTGGNITTAGLVSAVGDVSGGSLTTSGTITDGTLSIASGIITSGVSATFSGNVNGGNLTSGGVVEVTGNVIGGNVTTAGLVLATGNVTGGNVTTAGLVLATGNVTGGNLTTAGLASVTGNVTAGNLVTDGEITDGTLTINSGVIASGVSATFSGNATAGNLNTGGVLSATGNVSGGNITTGAKVVAVGNIDTTSGIFNGDGYGISNIAAGNIVGLNLSGISNGTSNVNIATEDGNVTVGVGGNSDILILTTTGANITGTLNATGIITGDGGGLSNVVGANVTGEVTFAATANAVAGANVSGQVANALVSGTVYTAAQPNITSVGTLTSVSVSGIANVAGNVNIGASEISTLAAGTVTTTTTSQTAVASFAVSGINGIEFLVKGIDSISGNTSVATLLAVTDGSTVDYSVYGQAFLTGQCGALAVGLNGSDLELLVTPSSTNSTVWIAQYRFI